MCLISVFIVEKTKQPYLKTLRLELRLVLAFPKRKLDVQQVHHTACDTLKVALTFLKLLSAQRPSPRLRDAPAVEIVRN